MQVKTVVKDELWVKDENERSVEMSFDLIQPYDLLQYLFDEHGVDIPREHVRNFWTQTHARDAPWSRDHPASNEHIPVGLFYDACAFMNISMVETEKIWGVFISLPLWRPRSARNSRWLICCIREELILGDAKQTLYPFVEVIVASLNKAFRERVTRCNRSFTVTEIRGDWEGHKKILGLRSGWKSVQVCHVCNGCQFGRTPSIYDNGDDMHDPEWCSHILPLIEFLIERIDEDQPCGHTIA